MKVGEEEGHHGTEGAEVQISQNDGTVVTLEQSREINRYRRNQGIISNFSN
jgi:hypothetical protein